MSHWTEGKTNLAQSVLVQLRNFARETGEDPQVIQLRYATERLMYRISRSAYADRFVLKGAWLFFLWGDPQRATRDVDFAGHFANSEAEVGTIFREILGADVDVDDAIDFDPDSLEFIQTQEGGEYRGFEIRVTGRMGGSRLRTKIDLGFGDVLAEAPIAAELPAILDLPRPRMLIYSKEAVVAEKLEAIVKLGRITTRFKDFFDILVLSNEEPFEGPKLQDQIEATFRQRRTEIPSSVPEALQDGFAEEADSQQQWEAFRRRTEARSGPDEFSQAVARVREFAHPVFQSSAAGRTMRKSWKPGEGWA